MYLIYIPKNAITSLTFWKTNPWKHHWKTISCQSQSLYVGLLMYFSTLEYTWISCICMSDSTSQPWQMLAVSKLSQFSELLFRVWKEFSAFFSESFVTKSDVYIYIYISKYLSNHLLLLYLYRNLYDLLFDGHKLTLHSFFVVCRPWKPSNFQPTKPQRQQHSEWWISSPSSPRSVTQDFHHWKL